LSRRFRRDEEAHLTPRRLGIIATEECVAARRFAERLELQRQLSVERTRKFEERVALAPLQLELELADRQPRPRRRLDLTAVAGQFHGRRGIGVEHPRAAADAADE